jgi:hypothetical protein
LKKLLLSLLISAFLFSSLHGASFSTPPKKLGQGLFYLLKSYDGTSYDLTNDPCWTNTATQGVAVRTQWMALEKSDGVFDWSYTDQAAALAIQHKKKWSLLVTAGVSSPAWLKTAGAQGMMVNAGSGAIMWMPLPWDTVFQAKWGAFVRALAARYKSNPYLTYVVMGGPGRRAESFFVTDQADIDTFHSLGGLPKWQAGVQWIADLYASVFPKTYFILDLGSPEPTTAGQTTLQAVCDYGAQHYPGRFGVKSDGLAANYPPNAIGATEVAKLSPTTLVGYQFGLPQKGDVAGMSSSLANAEKYGAHFVEVYSGDCTDPSQASALRDASTAILSK